MPGIVIHSYLAVRAFHSNCLSHRRTFILLNFLVLNIFARILTRLTNKRKSIQWFSFFLSPSVSPSFFSFSLDLHNISHFLLLFLFFFTFIFSKLYPPHFKRYKESRLMPARSFTRSDSKHVKNRAKNVQQTHTHTMCLLQRNENQYDCEYWFPTFPSKCAYILIVVSARTANRFN